MAWRPAPSPPSFKSFKHFKHARGASLKGLKKSKAPFELFKPFKPELLTKMIQTEFCQKLASFCTSFFTAAIEQRLKQILSGSNWSQLPLKNIWGLKTISMFQHPALALLVNSWPTLLELLCSERFPQSLLLFLSREKSPASGKIERKSSLAANLQIIIYL